MTKSAFSKNDIWLAAGVRTPFSKVDGTLGTIDAIAQGTVALLESA